MTKVKNRSPLVLAIDTSCDDTSASVVRGNQVLSNIVSSQIALHQPYGGVFPTVAKLAHKENIEAVVKLALNQAKLNFNRLDALAVTVGPGLAPALEVGINYAKDLAKAHDLPLVAVDHIEAHLLSPFLVPEDKNEIAMSQAPHNDDERDWSWLTSKELNVLAIVLSGGHSEFVWIEKVGEYEILGQTIDDAAGECLDKIGRMLGLSYPAAPIMERLAKNGDNKKYPFPLPLTMKKDFNLSFSGLKTHAKNSIRKEADNPNIVDNLTEKQLADFCASTQTGVFNHVLYKLKKLFAQLGQKGESSQKLPRYVLLGGGVAANLYFRQELRKLLKQMSKDFDQQISLLVPYNKKICGDNAAMIGLVGALKFAHQKYEKHPQEIQRQPNLKTETWLD
ncbi:MAG: tRNA (adenosine(37)-N6)-threonylcarbamoyltransferase complex transferase subunit TsaD [Pseudomonadales bacterium]|jgi:N6-L-threonylcarbamoyladenine synthase|nr:tRNA (adenosine(37)-N6)-threonylcarbamoyltransferase complex transferase subunit TsaD [Pseudomonadales bacterium]